MLQKDTLIIFVLVFIDHVLFPTHKNEKTGRGIGDGRGVCTCDDRPQCMCNNPEKQQRRMGNSTKSSTSKLPSNLTTNRSEIVSTNMVSRRTGKLLNHTYLQTEIDLTIIHKLEIKQYKNHRWSLRFKICKKPSSCRIGQPNQEHSQKHETKHNKLVSKYFVKKL